MDPRVEKGQGRSLQEQDVDNDYIYIDEDLDTYLTDEDNKLRHMRIIITRKMCTQLAGFLKTISIYTESHLQTDQSCRYCYCYWCLTSLNIAQMISDIVTD